jgi:hypothetical protein
MDGKVRGGGLGSVAGGLSSGELSPVISPATGLRQYGPGERWLPASEP